MPRTVQVKTKVALSPTKKFSYLRISNIWIGKFLFFTVHLVYPSINLSLVLQSVVPHFHFSQFEFGVTESSLAPYHSWLIPWPRCCPRQIRVAGHAWLVFHLCLTRNRCTQTATHLSWVNLLTIFCIILYYYGLWNLCNLIKIRLSLIKFKK